MSDDQGSVISRIQKLMQRTTDRGCTEAEATAAASKVQELLVEHNLSMSVMGSQHEGSKRTRSKSTKTALYLFQRDLMSAIAQANFCHHVIDQEPGKSARFHALVGREINVAASFRMYEYLTDTMDALLPFERRDKRGRGALLWLGGCSSRLCERLEQKAEAMRQKDRAGRGAGGSTPGTALMLVDVYQSEKDENEDFRWGLEPGTTAARRAQRLAKEAELRAAYEALLKDPEYVREQERARAARAAYYAEQQKKDQEEQERRRKQSEASKRGHADRRERLLAEMTPEQKEKFYRLEERKRREADERSEKAQAAYEERLRKKNARFNSWEYRSGREAGVNVGLDDQITHRSKGPLIS